MRLTFSVHTVGLLLTAGEHSAVCEFGGPVTKAFFDYVRRPILNAEMLVSGQCRYW